MIGFDVSFGRTRVTGERGVYTVVFAYKEEQPSDRVSSPPTSVKASCAVGSGSRPATGWS